MSVQTYFNTIKQNSNIYQDDILVVFKNDKGKEFYFPLKLCKKPMGLEDGLKNQKLRF